MKTEERYQQLIDIFVSGVVPSNYNEIKGELLSALKEKLQQRIENSDYKHRRDSKQNYLFKKIIKERDKVCVICGSAERLEVAHIIGYAWFPEIAFSPRNGRLLCHVCHAKEDRIGPGTIKISLETVKKLKEGMEKWSTTV